MGVRDKLIKFQRRQRLFECTRPLESGWVYGYVLAVGEELFLTVKLDDRIRFDGFEVFRIEDVRDLKKHDYVDFTEQVLARRGLEVPATPRVDLSSMAEAVRSAGQLLSAGGAAS